MIPGRVGGFFDGISEELQEPFSSFCHCVELPPGQEEWVEMDNFKFDLGCAHSRQAFWSQKEPYLPILELHKFKAR